MILRPLLALSLLLFCQPYSVAATEIMLSGTLEGASAVLIETPEAWIVRRHGLPDLEIRPLEQSAALISGNRRIIITYEPLPFFPPDGAEASEGPIDTERGCITRILSSGDNAVAHCRSPDGRLLWAAVLTKDGWRFSWIADPSVP